MFSQLINNAAAAAQSLLDGPPLPPEAAPLREHAAAFAPVQAPLLRATSAQIAGFARTATAEAAQLQPLTRAWKEGDGTAQDRITAALGDLLQRVEGLLEENQGAYTSLSAYRDQILSDQATVTRVTAEIRSRIDGLNAAVQQRMRDLRAQQERVRILQAIVFPLPWMIMEIASLISSSRTMEQQLWEERRSITEQQHVMYQLMQAESAVQAFSGQLQLLGGSLQNLINALSVTRGQMMQVVEALRSSQQGTSPLVVEAYLLTLGSQADNLTRYLAGE
jgi:chromosome segregation ATPase